MNIHDKLGHLIQLRPYLSKEQYREVVASVVAREYTEKIQEMDILCKRTMVHDRTNLQLRAMNISEVSYGFVRKFL
jgi:hypothetical protein